MVGLVLELLVTIVKVVNSNKTTLTRSINCGNFLGENTTTGICLNINISYFLPPLPKKNCSNKYVIQISAKRVPDSRFVDEANAKCP